ncbi:MAG TPA: VOC family protein [Stellaceae bacterium]|nr:VOC family protein [Stellaceae bacterium]
MIRTLQSVALTVPDLEVGRAFYTTMGLDVRSEGTHLVFRCPGRDQDQLRLVPGRAKAIAWVCWGTREEELKPLLDRLRRANVLLAAPPAEADPEGIWLRDPDGILLNIKAAEAAPQNRPPVEINNPGQAYARLGRRGAPSRDIDVRPRKLGHLLKFSTNIDRDARFYTDNLGMKLSDRIGDLALFLRCAGDSDHHTLAIATSDAPGLHHLSWEMGNLDQVQLCAERMLAAGYRDAWGPGRHIYGSNYFHYVRDPWMSLDEFYWDIDFIPENATWAPEFAAANADALSQWATTPAPSDFLENYEALARAA